MDGPRGRLFRTAQCCMERLQVPAQGCLCLFPCHLQFTSSSFSFWPEDCCLGSRPDLWRAEAALSEEVLHISGCFRNVCSRQPSLLISLVLNSCKAHNSGQLFPHSPLCPALLENMLFPDEVTHSPLFLLPLLTLFFPLEFNERPASCGNPSPPVPAAAKVKPGARIVQKYRHRSERKERTIRAIYFPMHLSAWEKLLPQIAESAAADKLVNRMIGPQVLAISMDKALCVLVCFSISCGLHACEGRRDWGRKWLALTSGTHGICIPKVAQHSFGFLFQHLCRLQPLRIKYAESLLRGRCINTAGGRVSRALNYSSRGTSDWEGFSLTH